MKACAATGDVAPLILNLGARKEVRGQHAAPVALPLEVYPVIYGIRRVGGVRSRSGGFEEQKNLLLIPRLYGQHIALIKFTTVSPSKLSNQFHFVISGVKCNSVKFGEVE